MAVLTPNHNMSQQLPTNIDMHVLVFHLFINFDLTVAKDHTKHCFTFYTMAVNIVDARTKSAQENSSKLFHMWQTEISENAWWTLFVTKALQAMRGVGSTNSHHMVLNHHFTCLANLPLWRVSVLVNVNLVLQFESLP